jgi:polygalacturonase
VGLGKKEGAARWTQEEHALLIRSTTIETGFGVAAFGAGGHGDCLETGSVQAAVDACRQAAGGRVVVPGTSGGGSIG